jgi:membrane protein insertase Oxa1/YidC/SpoIIIJ
MTPTPSADPAQMRLMKFMPLMMGFIFYGFSAGLVLFWLTGNIVGIGQQLILNRFASEDELVIDQPRGRKKKKAKPD